MGWFTFWRQKAHSPPPDPAARIREQIQAFPFSDDDDDSSEDLYWRPLSGQHSTKDMVAATYLDLHTQCYEAYTVNPLAFSIIELTTSFVLGEGLTVSAAHPRVQQVIERFWRHPENHMEERVYTLCTELSLYGEVFVHFFVNPYDGTVVIRQIDPSLIDRIECDPEDIEKPLRYHRVPLQQEVATPDTLTLADDALTSLLDQGGQWLQAGQDVLHITINKVSNARRGRSDLAPLLPWLQRYKTWLNDRVLINRFKSSFVWDVVLTGADRKMLERKSLEYANPPEPGSVIIHNESEKWSAVEPKIQAQDAAEDGRALKLMIAAGAMLPEHYLADGDNGNRATAREMSLPTLLKFKRRQRVVKHMLRMILDRVIAEAQQAGRLGTRINTSYDLIFPEIDSHEQQTLAQSAHLLVQALSQAKTEGWISDETAMNMFFKFTGEEINIYEELQRVSGQQSKEA